MNDIILKLKRRIKDFKGHYDIEVKRKENGEEYFVEIDEDHTENLPLYDDKVVLQCWNKSL